MSIPLIPMISHTTLTLIYAVSFSGDGRYQFKKNEIRHIEGVV